MESSDILRDACAIFGCATTKKCSQFASVVDTLYLGLMALQHRGQESSGMVTSDGTSFKTMKGMGLVSSVYTQSTADSREGHIGIGHNRYSTSGTSTLLNCQPFVVHTEYGRIAVAHNGEIVNAKIVRQRLLKHGIGLSTESDSEMITQLLVSEPPHGESDGVNWESRIAHVMSVIHCSYSILLMTSQEEIYAFRDAFGNRPLCLGEVKVSYTTDLDSKKVRNSCSIYVVSSESCAFSSVGAEFLREVHPGEIVRLTSNGIESLRTVKRPDLTTPAFCIFEYVYFARADSFFEGQLVHAARKECGRQLAIEGCVDADIVSTIPDSATPAARGFSEQSGIPYESVVVKNRYIGRTFIQPTSALRKRGVTTKFGPLIDNIMGKRIILIDDSIVRGNTMPHIIELLKRSGAKEVHIRVASPPLKHPCFMGVNIPTHDELIANRYSPLEMAKHFGVDTLVYLSVEGLQKAVAKGVKDKEHSGHCKACLTGKYPLELEW